MIIRKKDGKRLNKVKMKPQNIYLNKGKSNPSIGAEETILADEYFKERNAYPYDDDSKRTNQFEKWLIDNKINIDKLDSR
jgi:hypothetical protein